MAIIPWEPFRELEDFFEKDELFPIIPSKWQKFPRVNVEETDKDVITEMEVVGVDPSKIDISLKDNILNVKGESEETKEEKKKHYYKKEFRKGCFERTVMLPAEVKGKEAKASYKDGVLKIVAPKMKEIKEDKIKISVKK